MFFCKFLFIFMLFSFRSLFSIDLDLQKNMIFVPGGFYTPLFKTSNDLDRIHVDSFFIDIYPVSNMDYKKFIIDNIEWNKENIKSVFSDKNYLNHLSDNLDSISKINSYPVVNVSWFAANAYCNSLNKRLPSVDEWEYIGFTDSLYLKNTSKHVYRILDWYISKQFNNFVSVFDMEINSLGIYGFYGYIWEWVNDFNSIIMLNMDSEGGGLEEVLYCGAVATNSLDTSDYVSFMRYAFRSSLEAHYTINSLGFRCAKDCF